MKRAAETTTPSKSASKSAKLSQNSSDLEIKNEVQAQVLVKDFVELYLTKKEGSTLLLSVLKAVLVTVLGVSVRERNPVITKAIRERFPKMDFAKIGETPSEGLFFHRVHGNTDILFSGLALRSSLTDNMKAKAGFPRLEAACIAASGGCLSSLNMPDVYNSKQKGLQGASCKRTGKKDTNWPNICVLGCGKIEGRQVFSILIENGCTELKSDDPPSLVGNLLEFTFFRERSSTIYPVGTYRGSFAIPAHVTVDHLTPLCISVEGGITQIDIPLLVCGTQQTKVKQVSWRQRLQGTWTPVQPDDGLGEVACDSPREDPEDKPPATPATEVESDEDVTLEGI